MSAFIDTRCENCGARIGYHDSQPIPPCDKCGHVNKPITDLEKKLEADLLREAGLDPEEFQ